MERNRCKMVRFGDAEAARARDENVKLVEKFGFPEGRLVVRVLRVRGRNGVLIGEPLGRMVERIAVGKREAPWALKEESVACSIIAD